MLSRLIASAPSITAGGKCPPNTAFREQTLEMLHVWLVDNPGGVFGDEMEPTTMIAQLRGRVK